MSNKPLLCFDLEATGTSTATDRIVQIALREDVGDPNREKSTSLLIDPGIPIPPEATAVHGITNDDVYGKPKFSDVAQALATVFKGCDLLGFNLSNFDIPLLWEEFYRAGIEWDLSGVRVIDAGTLFKRREERTLSAAVQFYCGREHVDAHDALGDVLATCDVLAAQIERYKLDGNDRELLERESSYEEKRVDLAGKIVLSKDGEPVWNFGKVKGQRVVDELGFGYWVLERDFPENLKYHIRRIIDDHNMKLASAMEIAGDGDPF